MVRFIRVIQKFFQDAGQLRHLMSPNSTLNPKPLLPLKRCEVWGSDLPEEFRNIDVVIAADVVYPTKDSELWASG